MTMITPSYLGETIEYSSLHACRSTLEDPTLWTISYFNQQASWIGIEQADISQLERHLAYARAQKSPLWLEETAYEMFTANPDGRKWMAAHERSSELIEGKDEKHDFRFHCVR